VGNWPVTLSRIVYQPEAIILAAKPIEVLIPIWAERKRGVRGA
jgi:hypothetical protein